MPKIRSKVFVSLVFCLSVILQFNFYNLKALELKLELSFQDTTICEGDTINQQLTISGNKPFYIVSDYFYPDTLVTFDNNTLIIKDLSEELEVVITEYGNKDSSSKEPISFRINKAPEVSAAISGGGSFCRSDSITPITAFFTGTAPWTLTYLKNTEENVIETFDQEFVLVEDESAVIEPKSVSDANCSKDNLDGASYELILNGNDPPEINGPVEVCVMKNTVYDTKFVDDVRFSWIINSGAESLEVTNLFFRSIKWIQPGIHRINLSINTGDSVCPESKSFLDVTVFDLPEIQKKNDTIINCFELKPTLNLITGANPNNAVYWPHANLYSHTISIEELGDYSFIESAPAGCSDTGSVHIIDRCSAELYIADAFTPNGDNINDELVVYGYYLDLKIDFFNPLGELVYSYYQDGPFWDGTSNNVELPNGTYIWVAEFSDNNGVKNKRKGKVSIIR